MNAGKVADEPKTTALEQHAQTIVVFILVGLLGWTAATVQTTSVEIAKIQGSITAYEQRINTNSVTTLNSNNQLAGIDKRLQAVETELALLRRELERGNSQ